MKRSLWKCIGIAASISALLGPSSHAQASGYKQTNLVSDTQGMALNTDSKLINPWGIAFIPGQPFWISDNNSGFTTLYDPNGGFQGAFVVAPPAGSSHPSSPTGIVAPPSGVTFAVGGSASIFLFSTEDGTLSGWTGGASSVLAVDNSQTPSPALGAVYKGLTLVQNSAGTFLLATNFRSGKVEVYDTTFHQSQVLGAAAFNDPALPAVPVGSGSPGYSPFGIHTLTISGQRMVLVTYALEDSAMHDPLHIAGSGVVDLFNSDGSLARRVTTDAHLNAPWGAVVPPAGFGSFAGNLLIGNFGDGVINAYDLTSGNFVGQMKDGNGTVITNLSLWDMVFGGGGPSGDPNTLYITAGLANEAHGLFASLVPSATPAPDFTISVSPATETITAGQSGSFTVTLAGLNGFSSMVSLSCSAEPINSTCGFSPANVSPASGGTATSMLTLGTSANPYMPHAVFVPNSSGRRNVPWLFLALGMGALFVVAFKRASFLFGEIRLPRFPATVAFLMVAAGLLAASGCGGYGNTASNGTQRGTTTMTITGTAGNLSHSASVTLTVQ